MSIEFDVNMNTSVLYDYSLYHTYRSMAGLLGTIVGVLLFTNFFRDYNILYLIFGLVTIFYLPVSLYTGCKRQMLAIEHYKKPLHYKLDEEGFTVSQDDIVQTRSWDEVVKAVSTSKSIFLYTSKNIATIFPRCDMGEDTVPAIQMICEHVDPKKNKIRF